MPWMTQHGGSDAPIDDGGLAWAFGSRTTLSPRQTIPTKTASTEASAGIIFRERPCLIDAVENPLNITEHATPINNTHFTCCTVAAVRVSDNIDYSELLIGKAKSEKNDFSGDLKMKSNIPDGNEMTNWMRGEMASARADLNNYKTCVDTERARQQSDLQKRILNRKLARARSGLS